MTDQQHPIIPSPELVQQWRDSPEYTDGKRKLVMVTLSTGKLQDIATKASQWGSDQELEACVEHLKRIWSPSDTIDSLYTARRPKPPSLKEQALEAQQRMWDGGVTREDWELVRRALEQLDD